MLVNQIKLLLVDDLHLDQRRLRHSQIIENQKVVAGADCIGVIVNNEAKIWAFLYLSIAANLER